MKKTLVLHIVAFLIVIVWGSTLISSKVLLNYGMREDEIFFTRIIIAYLSIWCISPRKIFSKSLKDELMMLALGITGGSLYFITENYALRYTMANNVAFIVAISPLFTVLLAVMFTRMMKLTRSLAIGSLLALAGVAIVIFWGKGPCCGVTFNPIGDVLALISSFSFGLYCLLLKQLEDDYSPVFLTRKVFGYGLLTTIPFFAFNPWQFSIIRFTEVPILFNILFLGLVASFLCFWMWSEVTNKLGAVVTSNYIYISPVATILVSWLVLCETMSLLGWVGSILILIGVILANRNI